MGDPKYDAQCSKRPPQPDCTQRGPGTKPKGDHFRLYNLQYVKKNWGLWPLFLLQTTAVSCVFFWTYRTSLRSTIDVQLTRTDHRFELPSVPKFYDLRNPRLLKLWKLRSWEPAIHLDNRYRQMRHETMLDASGKPTNVIGEDPEPPIYNPYEKMKR